MATKPDTQQDTIRLPLYTNEQQRLRTYANSTNGVGELHDQVLVNCFPVAYKNPFSPENASFRIQPRLGFKAVTNIDLLESQVDGLPVVNDPDYCYPVAMLNMEQLDGHLVIAYVDTSNGHTYIVEYRPLQSVCSQLLDINTVFDNVHLSELTMNDVPYLGITGTYDTMDIGFNGKAYYASGSGGSLTTAVEITDAEFPSNATFARHICGPLVQLNARAYIMTKEGHIHCSDVDDLSLWHTNATVAARSYPDRGQGLARYKHHLVVFGENTIEFFNDEGNAGPAPPIERTDQAFIKIGCLSQKGYTNEGDNLWWISRTDNGDIELWKLDGGYQPKQITKHALSLNIQQTQFLGLGCINLMGSKHIILNVKVSPAFPGTGFAAAQSDSYFPANTALEGILCYCVDSDSFWIWAGEFDSIDGILTTTQTFLDPSFTRRYLMYVDFTPSALNYGIHAMYAEFNDDQKPINTWEQTRESNDSATNYWRIPIFIRTNVYDFGKENRVFIRRATVIMDKVRASTEAGDPYALFASEGLRFYLLDAKSEDASDALADWGVRYFSIPTDTHRYYFNNYGTRRQWKFAIFCNNFLPMRLEALELKLAQGSH